jgi:hypothetical protein
MVGVSLMAGFVDGRFCRWPVLSMAGFVDGRFR